MITLVIIGVIAAMTVPVIMQNANESANVSKVKKGISILGQAKILAEAQNGPIADWDYGASQTPASAAQLWSYLKPHIQVAKDCGTNTGCYQTNGTYFLSGNTTNLNHGGNISYYKFVLSDGSVMWFRTKEGKCTFTDGGVENACAVFFYDVNGDKEPNAEGRDIFLYVISSGGVYPYNTDDCYKNRTGYSCAAYILKNGNMNYLH